MSKLVQSTGVELVHSLTKDFKDAFKTQIRNLLGKMGFEDAQRRVDKARTMLSASFVPEESRNKSPMVGKEERNNSHK